MKRVIVIASSLAVIVVCIVVAVVVIARIAAEAGGPDPRHPTSRSSVAVHEGAPLGEHFVAPYVDVSSSGDLADLAAKSKTPNLTVAFLQTEKPGSCTPYWAGDAGSPVTADVHGAEFDRIRSAGGEVIPSFGGNVADTAGTDIADSCADVHKIALAYESVFAVYKVHRIDLDVEANSLSNRAGIDRRNQAIAEAERWGKARHWSVSFSYTLPTTQRGLFTDAFAVLESAAKHRADVASVDIMPFDWADGATHDMLSDAETAATALVSQLEQTILPGASQQRLWGAVGIVEMIGIDDSGTQETFTIEQAGRLVTWARETGVQTLSFWALQRDNGGCPGGAGQSTCSGAEQVPWAYSAAFSAFDES